MATKKNTAVLVHFPDGQVREGYYDRKGASIWHHISSSTHKHHPSTAGWWAMDKQGDPCLCPWFEENSNNSKKGKK
jgi:hypothetical protein